MPHRGKTRGEKKGFQSITIRSDEDIRPMNSPPRASPVQNSFLENYALWTMHNSYQTEIDKPTKKKVTFSKSNEVLLKIKAVFPFDFFPDCITVSMHKVDFISNEFFYSQQIHSFPIKNIGDVILECGPFFAALRLTDMSYVENLATIRYLKKKDALKARRIIQGLIIAGKENIAIDGETSLERMLQIEELGRVQGSEV